MSVSTDSNSTLLYFKNLLENFAKAYPKGKILEM